MLEGRDLVAGLGLAAFMLILFPVAASATDVRRGPTPVLMTLLGLEVFFTGTGAAFGGGAGCAMAMTAAGFTNMPRPGSQSKYRSPRTLPSFLPLSSSNSTPIHSPAEK